MISADKLVTHSVHGAKMHWTGSVSYTHLAAYAAKAGLRGAVIVPDGKIAQGKMAQTLVHGARVISLAGNFDQALTLVRELTDTHPIVLVNLSLIHI